MPLTSRGYDYPAPADPADGPADMQALAASVDSDIAACLPPLSVSSLGDVSTLGPGAWTGISPDVNGDALVVVIRPRTTITPGRFIWWCSTQAGNYDVAIINWTTRARLWSLGSTPCPVPGQVSNVIVAGPTLTAGVRYGLVLAASDATIGLYGADMYDAGMGTLYDGTIGVGLTAASFPIPATLGAWAGTIHLPALSLRA